MQALAGEVLRQSQEIAARCPDGVPDLAAAEARLSAGVTALEGGEPLLGGSGLLRAARALAAAAEAAEPSVGQTMLGIVVQLDTLGEPSLDELALLAIGGVWEAVVPLASTLALDEYALVSVVDYAARPALVAAAGRLQQLLNRCARCGTGWAFPRLACVWCGEQDADALRAVHGEGDAGVRQADCCNTCRGYLKAIAVLDPLDYVSLLTTDLETAGLDLVAVDRGYTRGSARSGCLGATRSR
jgi:hypothetical protein